MKLGASFFALCVALVAGCGSAVTVGDEAGTNGAGATGDGPTTEGGDEPGSAAETGGASTSGSSTGVAEPCQFGMYACPDTSCSWLGDDAWNCGECGRVCPLAPYNATSCRDSECVPSTSPCAHPEDGISTCEELCATIGQQCAGDRHFIFFSNRAEASCNFMTTASRDYEAGCEDPFRWDEIGGDGDPVVAVHCICTNEL